MEIQRAVLLIADIGGYTRFMTEHRLALAHAQLLVAKLLESIIDAAGPMKLAKLEGDAAFLYAPISSEKQLAEVGDTVAQMRRAFRQQLQDLVVNNDCTCKGCDEVALLKLKFVVHAGEVAYQKVKRLTELAGVDVILVHRMLKNAVPLSEYVLMTEPVRTGIPEDIRGVCSSLEHDFENIGPTLTHYIDLVHLELAIPPVVKRSAVARFVSMMGLVASSVPYWLGLREPCVDFHNVEAQAPPARAVTR
jgi:class 3 adenylate cyclase